MFEDNIINIIIDAISKNNYEILILILSAFFFTWSYNEFRKNYIDVKVQNSINIKNSLEVYSKLYFSIEAFQNKNLKTNELFDCFSKAIVYLPKNITKEILELNKITLETEPENLNTIKRKIASQIEFMKSIQNSITTLDYNSDIIEITSSSFSLNNFDSFIYPFIYSFFAYCIILLLVPIALIISSLSGFLKIYSILLLINVISSLMLIAYLVDLGFIKVLKSKIFAYFVLCVILPFCLSVLVNIKFSLINTITIGGFVYKKIIKTKHK